MSKKKLHEMIYFLNQRYINENYSSTFDENVFVLNKNNKNIVQILLNYQIPMKEFNEIYNSYQKQFEFVVPIFYKDNKTFFRRTVDRNKAFRNELSLKNYSNQEIHHMISLTRQEITAKNQEKTNTLYYFQPETQKTHESLINVRMKPVLLDYSHLPDDHIKKHKNEFSKTYFIPTIQKK